MSVQCHVISTKDFNKSLEVGRCKSTSTIKQTAEDFHIPQQGISQHRLHCLESTSFVARSKLF